MFGAKLPLAQGSLDFEDSRPQPFLVNQERFCFRESLTQIPEAGRNKLLLSVGVEENISKPSCSLKSLLRTIQQSKSEYNKYSIHLHTVKHHETIHT